PRRRLRQPRCRCLGARRLPSPRPIDARPAAVSKSCTSRHAIFPGGGQEPMDHLDKDRRMLHALGYAQELRRGMSGFSNFAISFTIISILSGTLTLYGTGINYGGPVEEAYGWPLVSVFVVI